jgi:hypothetical protein
MMMMMMTATWIYAATKTKIRRYRPLSAADVENYYRSCICRKSFAISTRSFSRKSKRSSPTYYLPEISNPWLFPGILPLATNLGTLNNNQAPSQTTNAKKSNSANKTEAKLTETFTTKTSSEVSNKDKNQKKYARLQSYLCMRLKKERFLKSPIARRNRTNMEGKIWTLKEYKAAVKRAVHCMVAAFGTRTCPPRFVLVFGDDAKRYFGDMVRENCKYEHRNTNVIKAKKFEGQSWLDWIADRERSFWIDKSAAIFVFMTLNDDPEVAKSLNRSHRAMQNARSNVTRDRQFGYSLDTFELEDLIALEQKPIILTSGGESLGAYCAFAAGLQNLLLSLRAERLATTVAVGGPRWCFSRAFRNVLQLQEDEAFVALVTVGQPRKLEFQDRIVNKQKEAQKQLFDDLIVDLY